MRFLLVIIASILAFGIISTAEAYTSKDDSALVSKLDPGFMPVGPAKKTDSSITTEFARSDTPKGVVEKFMISAIKKPPNVSPAEFAKNQYLGFVAGLGLQPAINEVSKLTPLPQTNSPFSAWLATASSKTLPTSIIVTFLDTDEATLYIVIYMVNRYLTPEEKLAAIAKVKLYINQVCYKSKNCYAIQ